MNPAIRQPGDRKPIALEADLPALDDVYEFSALSAFPKLSSDPGYVPGDPVPEVEKIYIANDTGKIYHWEQTLSVYGELSESPDVSSKLNSTALAPQFSSTSTYFVNDTVTYNGLFYRCVVAKTTASSVTPDNDIYNATSAPTNHWEVASLTTPDATLDITNAKKLRVVAANGNILWQEGYNLTLSATVTSNTVTLSGDSVAGYCFGPNSTDVVSLSLPTITAGKVGDFVLDVSNLSSGTEFSNASTYAIGSKVFYDGNLYQCSAVVDTAGEWTGDANWSLVYSAFDSTLTYAVNSVVVHDNAIWKCVVAVETAGDWTGTDNWRTASAVIYQHQNLTARIVVPAGQDLGEMLTFAPGTMCELYFTLTAFQLDSKPTWKVVRQDVENGGGA